MTKPFLLLHQVLRIVIQFSLLCDVVRGRGGRGIKYFLLYLEICLIVPPFDIAIKNFFAKVSNRKDIYINSNIADIYVNHSEDNKIRVELYS